MPTLSGVGAAPGERATSIGQVLSSLLASPQQWRLVYVDDIPELKAIDGSPLHVYHGYGPSSVVYTYEEGTVVFVGMAGEPDASTVPGQPMRVEVTASFYARDAFEDLSPIEQRLEQMREDVPSLGRKPILRWEWGERSIVGQMSTLRIQPETRRMISGNLLGFTAQFTLLRRREVLPEFITPSSPEPSTVHVQLAAHETFEWAAWRVLRNPDLGILVRRYNPDVTDEEGGSRIAVLPRGHSAHAASLDPISAPFAKGYEAVVQDHTARLAGGCTRWGALPGELTE